VEEEEAALEQEEDALLRDKAQQAAARARPACAPPSPVGVSAAANTAKAKRAADAEFEIEEEDDDEAEEENLMQNRQKEAQRLRDERLAAAALRHKKMMELSKGPMAALPSSLFFELSQRESLAHVPAVVQQHCVLLLPDMDLTLLAGMLQWMVTPANLASALEAAGPAEREGYGLGDTQSGACAPAGLPIFPFQVVGLTRGCLSQEVCMPALLPLSTQKHGAERGAPQPVVMIALAHSAESNAAGAAGVPDLARSVKTLLGSVRLEHVYLGDTRSAPTHEIFLNVPMTASLESVTSVISGKSAVSPMIKSPLFWFVCAPAVVDASDAPGAPGASTDDTVISVLRPEAVGKGALGAILAQLAVQNIDLTSLRMLFPSHEHYERSRAFATAVVPGGCPIIVLGSRGYDAVARWSVAVGPEDPFVAKRTDPTSLRAKYGVDRKNNLLTCSRSVERNRRESQWYFSLSHDIEVDESTSASVLPAIPLLLPFTMTATTLVLRAGVPGSLIAKVVSFCLGSGFRLSAFRRSTLEASSSQHVGLPTWINIKGASPPPVCLQWTSENAVGRLLRLGPALAKLAEDSGVAVLFEEACVLTSPTRQPSHCVNPSSAKAVFETYCNVLAMARTDDAAQRCGVHLDLNQGPECIDKVRFSSRLADMPSRFAVTKELPQAVCVVVTPDAVNDPAAMGQIFEALFINTGAELLGAKLLTWVADHAAVEMCPFPKDHYLRDDFLEHIEAGPAFVIAMRMVDGLERVRNIVGPLPGSGALAIMDGSRKSGPGSPAQTLRAKFAVDGVHCAVLPSNDAKHALRLLACIFEDDELSWPPSARGGRALVPPPVSEVVSPSSE